MDHQLFRIASIVFDFIEAFDAIDLIFVVIGVVAGVVLYFIPSFIAYSRSTHNRLIIFLLNLVLGWSLIGWLGFLIWALLDSPQASGKTRVVVVPPTESALRPLPRPAASYCSGCGEAVPSPDYRHCIYCGCQL